MTPEEFTKRMKDCFKHCDDSDGYLDKEELHIRMDSLMCAVLKELGYGEGVKIFKETDK